LHPNRKGKITFKKRCAADSALPLQSPQFMSFPTGKHLLAKRFSLVGILSNEGFQQNEVILEGTHLQHIILKMIS